MQWELNEIFDVKSVSNTYDKDDSSGDGGDGDVW
jgi:hypothetical protein